jgi:hypothetical protein
MEDFKALLRMSLPQDKIQVGKLRESRSKLMELSSKIKRLQNASNQLSLDTKTDYVNRALESRQKLQQGHSHTH